MMGRIAMRLRYDAARQPSTRDARPRAAIEWRNGDHHVVIALLVAVAIAGWSFWWCMPGGDARAGPPRRGLPRRNAERETLDLRLEAERNARGELEPSSRCAKERLDAGASPQQDFEKLRQESLNQAKAAVFETAQALSSKLLDDHKRESEAAKKDAEERVRQASEQLVEAGRRHRQGGGRARRPGGGEGPHARYRVALALQPGRRRRRSPRSASPTRCKASASRSAATSCCRHRPTDEVTGERLRPDALVFLPGNTRLVIDCKASKFLIEIAEAEGGEGEGRRLRQSRAHHEPASEGARRQELPQRGAGRVAQAGPRRRDRAHVSLMYLPNEAALEKLRPRRSRVLRRRRAQARSSRPAPRGFIARCRWPPPRSPASARWRTSSAFSTRRRRCSTAWPSRWATSPRSARASSGAADSFAKLTGSVNQRLLPRARRPRGAGRAGRNRALPANLPPISGEPGGRPAHRGRGGGNRRAAVAAAFRGVDFTPGTE